MPQETVAQLKSRLRAVGTVPASGAHLVCFYFERPGGGRDLTLPSWEVPCEGWEHMQSVVRAFNGKEN